MEISNDFHSYNATSSDFNENIKLLYQDNIHQEAVFNSDDLNGAKIFRRTLSNPSGLCSTFNMLEDKEMFTSEIADSYINHNDSEYKEVRKPRYASSSGFNSGLIVQVIDLFSSRCSLVPSFSIHLHSPYDYPGIEKEIHLIPFGSFSQIAITPKVTFTPNRLISYDTSIRHCYFEHEKKLKFFKIYTYSNCELECLVEQTLRDCKCVMFDMPHEKETRMCQTINDTKCTDKSYWRLQKNVTKCDCLPTCNEIQYDFKISYIPTNNSR